MDWTPCILILAFAWPLALLAMIANLLRTRLPLVEAEHPINDSHILRTLTFVINLWQKVYNVGAPIVK